VNVREASILMGAIADEASPELFDKEITDFSIDSRSVEAGGLFFALSQEDYARAGFNGTFADGHQYIEEAFGKGAIAVVARADRVNGDPILATLKGRLLLVSDESWPCKHWRTEFTQPGESRLWESRAVQERPRPRN